MAINETITATASLTTSGGKNLSLRGNTLIINDTSNNDIVIEITKDWNTSASASAYGGLYIKPTLNLSNEVKARFGGFESGKRYIFRIASDVVLLANNADSPALIDGDWPSTIESPRIDNYGLIMGRGGNNGVGGGLNDRNSYYTPKIKPTNGGTAIGSISKPIIVNNYGGISAGGGGSGSNTEYSQYLRINSNNQDYYSVMVTAIASGAGAPFGVTTRDINVYNDIVAMNNDIPWFSGRAATFNSNELVDAYNANLNYDKYVTIRVNYQGDTLTLTDTNINNTRSFNVQRKPQWWVDRKEAGKGSEIGYLFNYKKNNAKNYRPPYNGDPADQGGYLDSVMPAGLFRGGRGGNPEVNLMSDLYLMRFIPCMTPAQSEIWRNRWRGANGGDVGKAGNSGIVTPLWTMNYQSANKANYRYIEGAQGTIWGVGATADNYYYGTTGAGAYSGSLTSGSVTINNLNGGVTGGEAVLNKYDPNGTFDANARSSNSTLEFPCIY